MEGSHSNSPYYFEDFDVGTRRTLGERTIDRSEVVEFAEQFDPQEMHLDEKRAAESSFGGLVASGWHTAALSMRLFVDGLLNDVAVVSGLGVDDLRWYKPVEPGDTISVEATTVEKEPWDESRGRVQFRIRTYNQHDEEVMAHTNIVLVERDPAR